MSDAHGGLPSEADRSEPDGSEPDVDWEIDPEATPPEQRSDPRLELVAHVLRETHAQLASITSTVAAMERVIRECAEQGMTVDQICVQGSLDRAAVERVLAGGVLFRTSATPPLD